MRTRVYVDGFNLYYGALKGTSFKWLDPIKLAHCLLPAEHQIDKLYYFTARVSGVVDKNAPARQQVYLSALNTLPEVEVHFGSFLAKTIWRPLTNLPVADKTIYAPMPVTLPEGIHSVENSQKLPVGSYPQKSSCNKKGRRQSRYLCSAVIAEVHTMEEKGSDVNLAAHLLNDAWKELFDVAVVITNDTDLVTPIKMVADERGKQVIVVCPTQGKRKSAQKLKDAATSTRHIHNKMLKDAQFPEQIPGTMISKPSTW